VFAVVAAPLAVFFSHALLSEKIPLYLGAFFVYVLGLVAAATGWFVVYFGTKTRKFGVLEGVAASIVAWLVFSALCGLVGTALFGVVSWALAGAVFVYGLLLIPTWFVFLGGAFAGWLASKHAGGAR
jgi:hypothetical protein